MASQFIIDGYSLDVFNVKVSAVEGLDIVPKVKERTKHSWPDESGVAVDTSTDITYEAVTFSLKCRIKDSSYKDAVKRFNGLVALLSGDGYHLLGSITRGKLYPVVLDEVTGYKQLTATSANPVWIEFTLKLLCPLPECRMGSATVTASGAVSLNANTGKQVTVWWGDGTTSTGTGALNHTYTNAGTYTVLIAGTGVTKSVFTTTITVDEYSYPASGDVQNVDVSHTSEETWNALQAHLANLSPEYTDPQITTLKSLADGGIIPTAEATWLGATAKSVLSYLQKLVSKVYAINSRVEVLENNVIFDVTTTQDVVSVIITIDKNGNQLNLTDGTYSLSRYSHNGNNNGSGNISSVLINDINSDVYKQLYAAPGYNGINHKGGYLYSELEIKLTLKNGVLSWTGTSWGYDTPGAAINSVLSAGVSLKTLISIPYINKLTVKDQNSSLLIKSGTRFVLKKVN